MTGHELDDLLVILRKHGVTECSFTGGVRVVLGPSPAAPEKPVVAGHTADVRPVDLLDRISTGEGLRNLNRDGEEPV